MNMYVHGHFELAYRIRGIPGIIDKLLKLPKLFIASKGCESQQDEYVYSR
jgi:hypothetical protein